MNDNFYWNLDAVCRFVRQSAEALQQIEEATEQKGKATHVYAQKLQDNISKQTTEAVQQIEKAARRMREEIKNTLEKIESANKVLTKLEEEGVRL